MTLPPERIVYEPKKSTETNGPAQRFFWWSPLGLMVLRLVDLQIVNGAAYREEAQRKILRTYDQPASRGEILDCYGRPLVSNTLGFSISFDYYSWEKEEQNQVILDICAITQQAGLEHYDTLPITTDAPLPTPLPLTKKTRPKTSVPFIEDNEKLWRIPVEKDELKEAADEKPEKDADTDEQAVHSALRPSAPWWTKPPPTTSCEPWKICRLRS